MFTIPEKISLANLPTRIHRLDKLSEKLGKNIYLKRDDETGMELSGNKVRKLEYAIAEALRQNATTLITTGALQSNHCRATAVAAAKLGLKSVLVLVQGDTNPPNGNYLLDLMLGAKIVTISKEEYVNNRYQIMEKIRMDLIGQGEKGYIIPTGASNGIGMFGYIEAIQEIMEQEKEMNLHFDAIVDTVGSTGTYAGLVVGNALYQGGFDILGFSISDTRAEFQKQSYENILHCCDYLSYGLPQKLTPETMGISQDDLWILDEYKGRGYGLNEPEDYEFIREFAQKEGIFLDPVYTGKAMKGLVREIEKSQKNPQHPLNNCENILFIHTGGLYGIFPKAASIFEK